MTQLFLIGIGAGAASALLFASLMSGSLFSVLLVYLAPLPILIAGIGWTYLAGAVAALFATASLALVLDGRFVVLFITTVAIPAWWLGYLALLARPVEGAPPDKLEWFPPGHIVLWAALAGAASVIVLLPAFGLDAETFRTNLKSAIDATLEVRNQAGAELDPQVLFDTSVLVKIMPPMFASAITVLLMINTWLAARTVLVSGQLRRPWPELPTLSFPRFAPLLFAASLAGIFLPGILSVVSDILAACLMMAFAVLGFAVLHVLTRGTAGRPLVLGGVYTAVIIFGWPMIILALLGLADSVFDLRGRARNRTPPAPQ